MHCFVVATKNSIALFLWLQLKSNALFCGCNYKIKCIVLWLQLKSNALFCGCNTALRRCGCAASAEGAGMRYSARREKCAYIADAGGPAVHERDVTNGPRARLEAKWWERQESALPARA
jgi:hypothetical protein